MAPPPTPPTPSIWSCVCLWMTHSYVNDSYIRVTWLMHVERVMSYIYVAVSDWPMCVTWVLHMWDMKLPRICVTCLAHMCDMTHSYVWHDSFICVTWLIHMCDMTHLYVWHDSLICVTWHVHVCDTTHSYAWHASFIFVAWPIHIYDMIHSYVRRDSCMYVTWLIHTNDMTHPYTWHDSFKCVTWLTPQLVVVPNQPIYVTWLIDIYINVTRMNEACRGDEPMFTHVNESCHT